MKWKKLLICILSGGAMVLFMLDSKTALQSGIEGVQLCLQTVIPSLFPFFLMSLLLTDNLPTPRRTAPSRLERFLRLPAGSGMLVITGILGGYPVGAKVVGQSHCAGRLTKAQAQRMTVLCNAPGPAFLFGMVGSILGNLGAVWILWCHILLSAILCALIIPAQTGSRCALPDRAPVSIQAALEKAIPMMASVCAWIVLFRILTGYLQKWMPDTAAPSLRSLLFGLLELSNGIVSLRAISDPGV